MRNTMLLVTYVVKKISSGGILHHCREKKGDPGRCPFLYLSTEHPKTLKPQIHVAEYQ
jgi:hypothetical protein